MTDLSKTILTVIEQYIQRIVQKHPELKQEELMALWSNGGVSASQQPSRKVSSTSSSSTGCPYTFSKGKRTGEVCGAKSSTGGTFCSSHKNKDGKVPKEKKVLPLPKKSTESTKSNTQITLRSHTKLKVLYHPLTGIVFSVVDNEAKEAVSKIENEQIVPLTEEDVETCKKYRFTVSKEVLERLREEKEEENVSEVSEDEMKMKIAKKAFGVDSEEEVEL